MGECGCGEKPGEGGGAVRVCGRLRGDGGQSLRVEGGGGTLNYSIQCCFHVTTFY